MPLNLSAAFPGGTGLRAVSSCSSGMLSTYDLNTSKYGAGSQSTCGSFLFNAWLIANFVQSLAFGALHYYGIPSGFAGVALTTVYGFVMGALGLYADTLAFPVLLHVLADFIIFYWII